MKSTIAGGIAVFLLLFSAGHTFSASGRVQKRMKPIPCGTFLMGNDNGKANQKPAHRVTVSPFFMDSSEVTQKEFIAVMSRQPFQFALKGLFESNGLGDDYPMYNICWYDMVLYCNAISKEEGYDTVYIYDSLTDTAGVCGRLHGVSIDYSKIGYRLPTEAEWEYACRAGTTTDFFWGDEPAHLYAWFMDNSDRKTQPVGSKAPNGWGLYDMCGNVYDFCNDWYGPYDSSDQTDPHGPDTGSMRAARGGNMIYDSTRMRSAERMAVEPDVRYLYYGFRCMLPDTAQSSSIFRSPSRLSPTSSIPASCMFLHPHHTAFVFSAKKKPFSVYTLAGKRVICTTGHHHEFRPAAAKFGKGIYIIKNEQP